MPLACHHHVGAPIQTEEKFDLLMKHSGEVLPMLLDTGHLAFAGGDMVRVIDKHHARINHVHMEEVRQEVVIVLDWSRVLAAQSKIAEVEGDD